MVGSFVGIKNIDKTMLKTLFRWDPTRTDWFVQGGNDKMYGRQRPKEMSIGQNAIDSIFWLFIL